MSFELDKNKLSSYVKNQIISKFDPSIMVTENISDITFPHFGFYICIDDVHNNQVCKIGFLQSSSLDIEKTITSVILNVVSDIKAKSIPLSELKIYSFHCCLIIGNMHIIDPLAWDEKKDGVYFMWGQDYKSILLPNEIAKLNTHKIYIMDKLCMNAKLISNLWRLNEATVFKLICFIF